MAFDLASAKVDAETTFDIDSAQEEEKKKKKGKTTFKERLTPGKDRTLFGLPEDVSSALSPTATKMVKEPGGIKKTLAAGAIGGLETLGAPVRALGTLRKDPKTGERFKTSDPESALLRPEIEKTKSLIEEKVKPITTQTRLGSFGPERTPEQKEKELEDVLKGTTEFVGSILSDPTVLLSGTKSLAKAGLEKVGIKKGAGEIIEKTGKGFLRKGTKIKDATAKKIAADVDTGVERIVNNIAKHDVQSPVGGFKGIAKKAQSKIDKNSIEFDKIIDDVVKNNPDASIDLEDVTLNLIDDLDNGLIKEIPLDDIEKAKDIIFKQQEVLEKFKNLKGKVNLKDANIAKKEVAKKVFKKGTNIAEDPTKDAIKEIMSLRIRDEMTKHAPKATSLNKEISELILIKKAMLEANKRASNKDFLDLTNKAAALGAGGVALSGQSPETVAAILGFIALRRGVSKGKGASGLISLGKGIQKIPKAPNIATPGVSGLSQTLGKIRSENKEKNRFTGTLGKAL